MLHVTPSTCTMEMGKMMHGQVVKVATMKTNTRQSSNKIWGWGREDGLALVQVHVEDADIKLQGCSLKDLLEKYFVSPGLGLLPDDYWAGYKRFKMVLIVRNVYLACVPEQTVTRSTI